MMGGTDGRHGIVRTTVVATALLAASSAAIVGARGMRQTLPSATVAPAAPAAAVPQGPPFGEATPAAFMGAYVFENNARQCSLPVVVLTRTTLTMRGEARQILMTEKISDHDWHVWLKVDRPNEYRRVEELELFWDRPDHSYLVIGSDEEAAEAILDHGQPVADAGIVGGFERCR